MPPRCLSVEGPSTQGQRGTKAVPASSMTRWAVNKAPDHDTVRARNNQRRHRERTKAYIAELESKVASLQTEVDISNRRNEALTRELEELRRTRATPSMGPSDVQLPPIGTLPTTCASSQPVSRDRSEPGLCCNIGSDDESFPATETGESTTNCRTAFEILQQQSAATLDISEAEAFLRPGYRRAAREGDGCRVKTHLVYGLLDRITSS